jgi:prolyl-tRNA editing enzyme YbaK/EbsC (Cys-tRNA(Pro) deacylase)
MGEMRVVYVRLLLEVLYPVQKNCHFFSAGYNCSMRTVSDLQAFINKNQIPADLVFPPVATPTVEDAARAMDVHPDSIIKSVLFIIRRLDPLLVIANGLRRIDQAAIASRLGVGKKQVKIARPEQVLNWTGYPAGGVPPFGHSQLLPTWIDPAVLEQDLIFGGGGKADVLLRIRAADLHSVIQAEVVPVCR